MTLLNRTLRRVALVSAFVVAFIALKTLPRVCAQKSELPPVLFQLAPGGAVPTLVDPNIDFTDEHYQTFESYLDVPDDKDYDFYLIRLETLAASRRSLCTRWYRQRAAQLIEKIDAAIEKTRALYESTSQSAREKAFERFNSLVREHNLDELREFIVKQEKPENGWPILSNSTLTEMYEAYYALRIQDAALAGDDDALKETLAEISNTDDPAVAKCAENLVELVSVYDAELAPQFIVQAFNAYNANNTPMIRNAAHSGRAPRLFKPEKKLNKDSEPLFNVPDDRDLEFYRKLYQEISQTPAVKDASGVVSPQFERSKRQALKKVLRYIVMITHDSPEGVRSDELERYKSLVLNDLNDRNYSAAMELVKMGAISLERGSADRERLAMIQRQYFGDLIQYPNILQTTPERRNKIIAEFTEGIENNVNVFLAYETYAGTLRFQLPEFDAALRAAICEAGLKSKDPEILLYAKRFATPEKTPDSLVGQTVDLRGLDVNMRVFDAKQFEGKPIVLILATQPNLLLQASNSQRFQKLRAKCKSGEIGLVGYITSSSASDAVLNRGGRSGQYEEELSQLRQAWYPTLLQGLALYSNDMSDTDYPLLDVVFNVKETSYVALDVDRKIVGVYTLSELESGNVWKLEQCVDNLMLKQESK